MLMASDAAVYDSFGSGLALHDDLIVIGASMSVYDVGACGPGKGYVFERTPGGWVEAAIFAPHGYGGVATLYGFTLDTDGATIIFGAPADDGAFLNAGAVYVYERDKVLGWHETAKLIASDATTGYCFGSDVAVDGNQILVGSQEAGSTANGAVYVFEKQGSVWAETQVLRASNGMPMDAYGASVDLDGDRGVVGASGVDSAAQDCKAIYILERGASGWSEMSSVVASDEALSNRRFGKDVRIDGNQVLWSGQWSTEARLTSIGVAFAANDCSSTPNSSGSAASMSVQGCDSHMANALELRATGLPANKPGMFFPGSIAAQLPAGNGTLCIAGPQRLVPLLADAGGVLEMALDFQSSQALSIIPGSTWRFQAFFRDPGVGTSYDFSDGIAVEIQL
ncbi:MAG: hypothetical protein ACI9F9_001616 [Candidatus Paceibacteria bacterium]|jgi:hypothetical protein